MKNPIPLLALLIASLAMIDATSAQGDEQHEHVLLRKLQARENGFLAEPQPPLAPVAPVAPRPAFVPRGTSAPTAMGWSSDSPFGKLRLHSQHQTINHMAGLQTMWQAAASDDDREKIEAFIAESLQEDFDADMELRQQELEKIQTRVKRLKDQLAEREDNRDEMVNLKLKEIVMEWKGLGWGSSRAAAANPFIHLSKPVVVSRGNGSDEFDFQTASALFTHAAARKNDKLMGYLAGKIGDSSKAHSSDDMNQMLWKLWESNTGKIKAKEYWQTLADIGQSSLKEIDPKDKRQMTLIQDTVAHLLYEAGDLKQALELQEQAAEQSENDDIQAFLKTLLKEADE